MEYNYDLNNNVTHFAYADRNTSFVTAYEYGKDNLLTKTTLPSGKEVGYTYDNLGRLTGKTLDTTNEVNTTYTYHDSARGTVTENDVTKTYTTSKLATEETPTTGYSYEYDDFGNIIEIYEKIKVTNEDGSTSYVFDYNANPAYRYYYDKYNQLIKVKDGNAGLQTEYAYDESGNITSKSTRGWDQESGSVTSSPTTITYEYNDTNGWGDLLTSYNGQTITYDAIGNPLTYRDGISLTWQNGRRLASFAQNGTTVNYTYDVSGMRTGKTVTKDGTTTEYNYVYENGLLLQMTRGSRIYDFSYDANGTPVSIAYRSKATANPTYYYYGTNWRGDVVALYSSTGAITALYEYDAYGNVTVKSSNGQVNTSETHIANVNPLGYRGYVYDKETGFYYLQSRYYDPTTCRFINADVYYDTGVGLTGLNMFAYCNNNPVIFSDDLGTYTTYAGFTYDGVYFEGVPAHQLGWYGQIRDYWKDGETNARKEYGLTHSSGLSVGINIGNVSVTGQGGFASDIKGNVAIQLGFSIKYTTMTKKNPFLSVSAGSYSMYTLAPSIDYLYADGYQGGLSAACPVPYTPISIYKDISYNIAPTGNGHYGGLYSATSVTYPQNAGGGMHAAWGLTDNVWSFNLFEIFKR